jgi:hypothetical protein
MLRLSALPHAAATAGVSTAQQDQQKWITYARGGPHGYAFVASSVEMYRWLDQPAMKLLQWLEDELPASVVRRVHYAGTYHWVV